MTEHEPTPDEIRVAGIINENIAGHPAGPYLRAARAILADGYVRVGEMLLTLEQLSEETGIAENSLRYWRVQGTGPKSARIGRRVMYRRSDVDAWIDQQFEEQGA